MRSVWWGAVMAVLLGVIIGGYSMLGTLRSQDLLEVGQRSTITEVVSHTRSHLSYFEAPDGERYGCDANPPLGSGVVFDPEDPSRCRPEWAVGAPTTLELLGITLGVVLILGAVLAVLFDVSMKRDDMIELVRQGRLAAPPLDIEARGQRQGSHKEMEKSR